MRYIAIADIHGEIRKLESVLSKITVGEYDTVVFMGDYIDRGEHSREVVDRIIEYGREHRCVYLMGSHEYAYLQARKGDEYFKHLFFNYGGPATIKSYGGFEEIYATHGDFFDNLKFYYLTDNFLFVHAGINPGISLENQNRMDLIYIRNKFIKANNLLPQRIIFGHTEFERPYIRMDKIGIDLGCGKTRSAKLCALILDNGKESFVYSD